MSMFERYGGFGSVRSIVMSFYDKVLDSDEVGPFFDDIDMKSLIDHQMRFVAQIMGGPDACTDKELKCMHARMNITSDHFSEVATYMQQTLEEFDVAPNDVQEIMSELAKRSPLIITA